MKARGSLMVVPSSMADAMGAGSYAGLAALHGQVAAAGPAGTAPGLPAVTAPGRGNAEPR